MASQDETDKQIEIWKVKRVRDADDADGGGLLVGNSSRPGCGEADTMWFTVCS
jgi:hypothetical protein